MNEEKRIVKAIFDALVRGAVNRKTPDAIKPFDPEGADYLDIEWHDGATGMYRSATIRIDVER